MIDTGRPAGKIKLIISKTKVQRPENLEWVIIYVS